MDEDEYKVSRLLRPLMELAVKEQKGANISVDCRLYFRFDPNDGRLKGEVAFIDRDGGKLVKLTSTSADSLPLDSEDGMIWFLGKVRHQGLDFVRERRDAEPA
jgi:hypothetical protein